MRRSAFKSKLPPARPAKQYAGRDPSAARAPAVRVRDERAQMVVPLPKFVYVRSPALLANVKQLSCTHCRRLAPTDPAHSNWAIHGKGKSVKASDIYIAALCRYCHTELDQGSALTDDERKAMWWRAHVWTVKELLGRDLWPLHLPVPDIVNYPEQWA